MTSLVEAKHWFYAAMLIAAMVLLYIRRRRHKNKAEPGSWRASNHGKKRPATAAKSVADNISWLQTSFAFRIDDAFEARLRSLLGTAKYYRQLGFTELAHDLDEVAEKAVERLKSRCELALKNAKIENVEFPHHERSVAACFVLNPEAVPEHSPGTFLLEIAVGPAGSRPACQTSRYFAVRLEKGRSMKFDAAETLISLPDRPNSITDEVGNLRVTAADPWVCEVILGNRQLAKGNCPCPPFLEEYEKILRSL